MSMSDLQGGPFGRSPLVESGTLSVQGSAGPIHRRRSSFHLWHHDMALSFSFFVLSFKAKPKAKTLHCHTFIWHSLRLRPVRRAAVELTMASSETLRCASSQCFAKLPCRLSLLCRPLFPPPYRFSHELPCVFCIFPMKFFIFVLYFFIFVLFCSFFFFFVFFFKGGTKGK